MGIDRDAVANLVALIDREYPGWTGFGDERFVKEERTYKLATREKAVGAQGLLRRERLEQLIRDNAFATIVTDLETIGHSSNLLYLNQPSYGDLKILYDEHLDKEAFSRAVFELLYGEGPSEKRLDDYVDWVITQDLPNKWTFPTYYLFICHEGEMFVKPEGTKWFMQQVASDPGITKGPSGERYAEIKRVMAETGDVLAQLGKPPADWIDLQSFLWATHFEAKGALVKPLMRKRFAELFAEFVEHYAQSKQGLIHAESYDQVRKTGRKNFEAIIAAADKGQDVTELVLKQLLPHTQSAAHEEGKYWIHVAPAINGDIRTWFEATGDYNSAWPDVAAAILAFVRQCNDDPESLATACQAFADNPASKGFQQGMLSPILNALRPDDFLLINNKSRRVVSYFGQQSLGQSLTEYPAVNDFEQRLIAEMEPTMTSTATQLKVSPSDVFDQFCHWLVAIKKEPLSPVGYWKIAPGENARTWPQCEAGNYISVGWDEFGDLSAVTKDEFAEMRDKLIGEHGWTKSGMQQVWRFAKDIKPGDYIVANRGKSQVIGIGIVTGPYFFVSGAEEHRHRIPIDWLDTGIRNLEAPQGWQKTLVPLTREDFEAIEEITPGLPEPGPVNPECPFSPASRDLLTRLALDPTRMFYSRHKDELKTHVELPVQSVLKAVVDRVAPPIRAAMETKHRLFSMIPKNDYGRGGAWPFYWGTFYPKGGKKTEGAQLYVSLDSRGFTYGFSVGNYASDERKRLVRNCTEYAKALVAVLAETISAAEFSFGSENTSAGNHPLMGVEGLDLSEWLDHADSVGPEVRTLLSWEDLLGLSLDDLVSRVAEAFDRLFPLVILATSDNPLSLVQNYLEPEIQPDEPNPVYTLEAMSSDTGFSLAALEEWVDAIHRKKQAILYGPPGTGKTYMALKLAEHIIGGSYGETEIVQFHPAYAYEDFIQGIRPESDGEKVTYPMVPGRFLEFCEKVRNLDGCSVLIIDEINRAELSRVFGELMYLMEYRDEVVRLASGRLFSIPSNLRIIGTMNTADRSIALVDNALRRRFAFLDLYPDPGLLDRYHERLETGFDTTGLKAVLQRVNNAIGDPHFHVGVSFFMDEKLGKNVEAIWKLEIYPYLDEYFFNRKEDLRKFQWDKVAAEIQGATEPSL
jgi:5-methylcytosine-specific restriction protein B